MSLGLFYSLEYVLSWCQWFHEHMKRKCILLLSVGVFSGYFCFNVQILDMKNCLYNLMSKNNIILLQRRIIFASGRHLREVNYESLNLHLDQRVLNLRSTDGTDRILEHGWEKFHLYFH